MTQTKTEPVLLANARALRKTMTPQERKLWYQFLRLLPQRVYRQKVLGDYIVDFYVSKPKTVIELDGSQHFEFVGLASDKTRDAALRRCGCQILRYPNNEVDRNFEGVCADIAAHLGLDWDNLFPT